jgi:2Fe-2S ferredoxin
MDNQAVWFLVVFVLRTYVRLCTVFYIAQAGFDEIFKGIIVSVIELFVYRTYVRNTGNVEGEKMPLIRYVGAGGDECTCDATTGVSVMLTAIRNGVRGIEGECGGSLDCATCHVYVDGALLHLLPPPSAQEQELLAAVAAECRPASRLSCQLHVPAGMEMLIVHIPEGQL